MAISERHQAFIDALLKHKGNATQAARDAGYTDTYGFTLMRVLKDDILKAAEEVMALHAIRAANVLVDGMEGELSIGASNQLDAAKQVLDRVGLIKKERIEVTGINGGIFILPPKSDA